MKLNLKRPIIFFDIEATGLDISTDRIVELSFIKIHPNGNEESQTLRFNPGIHISEDATRVNGIKDEDVADCSHFRDKAKELAAIFEGCDIAGFNSNFYDVPLLMEEFYRSGVQIDISKSKFVDVQNIYHKLERRDLTAAYKFYCGKDLTAAHTANADTRATYEVLQAQLDKYGDKLKNDVDFLADFSKRNNNVDLAGRIVMNDKGEEIINFGKHKGTPVKEVLAKEPAYYSWIQHGKFTQDTKMAFARLKLKYQL